MKKIILILCIVIFITGCENIKKEKQNVVINLPADNTVNGYRLEGEFTPDSIPETEVSVSQKETITVNYCGNKNSKVFHKLSCSSLKNMKEENKVYFATKEEFSEKGYSPCKMCNP